MANYVGCSRCGKRVSNDVGVDIIVRAYIECPECVEKKYELSPLRKFVELEFLKDMTLKQINDVLNKLNNENRELKKRICDIESR